MQYYCNSISALYFSLFFLSINTSLSAQKWITEKYAIETVKNVPYGVATNFGGREDTLHFDVSFPTDDTLPACGRPLLLAVHGGAFIRGSRSEGLPVYWRETFAKRGYTAASVQYRLGVFPEDRYINCNVDAILGVEWNCSNFTDSIEWYRAMYRAQQDVKGCIRYMVQHKDEYHINPEQIYLIGESAGGFTVLSVGYLDDPDEKLWLYNAIDSVPRPNDLYKARCLQNPGLAASIDALDLSRPDLGQINGELNTDAPPFIVRGVASFYGGIMHDLFSRTKKDSVPALYMFHQPNDLLVPINYGRVLTGVSDFFTGLGCQQVVNRPYVWGSKGILSLVNSLKEDGFIVPTIKTHFTNNYASAWEQVLNPSTAGHAVQDYKGTANEVAAFFAPMIVDGNCTNVIKVENSIRLKLSPNPATDVISVEMNSTRPFKLEIYNLMGQQVLENTFQLNRTEVSIKDLPKDIYIVRVNDEENHCTLAKFIKL